MVVRRMERISLYIFLGCLVTCATAVVSVIWIGEDAGLPEYVFKTIATIFIIGLANFLTWFVFMAYRYVQGIES